jgi:hypothetical protein
MDVGKGREQERKLCKQSFHSKVPENFITYLSLHPIE